MWVTVACMSQTVGPLAVEREFIPIACTGFWGQDLFSLDGTLLSIDVVGRALDFPQNNMPYLLGGVDVGV